MKYQTIEDIHKMETSISLPKSTRLLYPRVLWDKYKSSQNGQHFDTQFKVEITRVEHFYL